MEMFDERLSKKLRDLMVGHTNEKKNHYEWWCGCKNFEHMKNIFMSNYFESEWYRSYGYNQEQYLDWIVSHIEKKKRKEEERRKKRAMKKNKIKINLTKEKEVTGPIYDDDEKPTFYKW